MTFYLNVIIGCELQDDRIFTQNNKETKIITKLQKLITDKTYTVDINCQHIKIIKCNMWQ